MLLPVALVDDVGGLKFVPTLLASIIAGVHRIANRTTIMVMDDIPAMSGPDPVEPGIPDKLFFRIGEVSQIVGVEPYVVRYWESEFKGLAPKKSSSGQRMFRRKDVELLLEIKRLLYERKFTVEGARRALSERSKPNRVLNITYLGEKQGSLFSEGSALPQIRREVAEILKLLARPEDAV